MVVELRPEDLENKELRMMNEEPAFNSQLNMMYFRKLWNASAGNRAT